MGSFFIEISQNVVFWTAAFSWFIAQFIKFIIEIFRNKTLSLYVLLLSTGGMPSSHSSFVVAMSTTVGFKEGFGSSLFAACSVISMIIMVDAAGVRRAAGKQAAVLNMLVEKLNNPRISLDEKLRELLGHTPVEVGAGAVLGVLIGVASSRLNGFF